MVVSFDWRAGVSRKVALLKPSTGKNVIVFVRVNDASVLVLLT